MAERSFSQTGNKLGCKVGPWHAFWEEGRRDNRGHLHCYLPFIHLLTALARGGSAKVLHRWESLGEASAGLLCFLLVLVLEVKLFLGNREIKGKEGGRTEERKEGREGRREVKDKEETELRRRETGQAVPMMTMHLCAA